jgi:transcriptional regulator with PAS, ATPase and Fis domain
MERIFRLIENLEHSEATVLLTGESGTGKEVVAHAIHARSPRRAGPFVAVNCGALPGELLESELFGHVRGAFTGAVRDRAGRFELAAGGTLFLDEVADVPLHLQVKLLRVLQEMQVRPVGSTKAFPVDVRVIAATNRDLERAMTEGSFRQDLFYRLNVVRITLPPLRERRDDISALVTHFLRRFNRRFHREVRGVAPDALAALTAYSFPGNVRELENLIERAYAMGAREQISLGDLPSLGRAPVMAPVTATAQGIQAVPTLADVERELILKALAVFKDDKEAAARALGISRRTIYRRLKEYGVL